MKNQPTPPKTSKRQLERHLTYGKNLLQKVTAEMGRINKDRESLAAQLKAAQAYLGVLVMRHGEINPEALQNGDFNTSEVISKELITGVLKTKIITAEESENKEFIIIKVMEAPNNDQVDETAPAEAIEVSQPESDTGRDPVCEQERGCEIPRVEDAPKRRRNKKSDAATKV